MRFAAWTPPLPAPVEHVFTAEDQAEADALAAVNGMAAAAAGDDVRPRLWRAVAAEGGAAFELSPPSAADLKARLNGLRKEATRVITVSPDLGAGPIEIAFDAESADLGPLAHILALIGSGGMPDPFMFRGGGVSRLLSHAEFMAAYALAAPKMQAAFTVEGLLSAEIEAGAITDFAGLEAAFAAALE